MRRIWREWGYGLALGACFTLGCGRTGDETTVPLDLTSGPGAGQPESPAEGPGEPDAPPAPPLGEPAPLPADPRREVIQSMLARECSTCHDVSAGGRFGLDGLVADGYLVPGRAETSAFVTWLQYGPSRVEHAGVHVAPEEFDAVVGYTNALPRLEDCPGYDLTDRDRALEHLLLDINSHAPEDRPFIRYVGAIPANTPSGCNGGLTELRAFLGFVNSVSLGPRPIFPEDLVPSDASAPIFRVDIRDLGWAAPVDVDGLGQFSDRWEAIAAAANPYALELDGPEADALKRETGTSLPFVPAAAFVSVASVGALYYALVGVGQNVNALAASLGVEDDVSPQRAGVFGDGSWPDRVIRRRAQTATGGAWWTRAELAWSGTGPRPLAEDPVGYPDEGGEIIFTLPNGYFAFAIAGSDGTAVRELPSCIGGLPCPTAVRAENSITCRGCHAGKLNGFSDEVLPHLDADPSRYPAELVPLITDQYRPGLGLALDADNAVAGTAMQAVSGDLLDQHVTQAYYDFTARPLSAIDVADELGVTIEGLRTAITTLGAGATELAPLLSGGSIERAQLTPRFKDLACSLAGFRNVPANCP